MNITQNTYEISIKESLPSESRRGPAVTCQFSVSHVSVQHLASRSLLVTSGNFLQAHSEHRVNTPRQYNVRNINLSGWRHSTLPCQVMDSKVTCLNPSLHFKIQAQKSFISS